MSKEYQSFWNAFSSVHEDALSISPIDSSETELKPYLVDAVFNAGLTVLINSGDARLQYLGNRIVSLMEEPRLQVLYAPTIEDYFESINSPIESKLITGEDILFVSTGYAPNKSNIYYDEHHIVIPYSFVEVAKSQPIHALNGLTYVCTRAVDICDEPYTAGKMTNHPAINSMSLLREAVLEKHDDEIYDLFCQYQESLKGRIIRPLDSQPKLDPPSNIQLN